MLSYLKPHSPEWFAALRRVNPTQAEHTQQIISLAGRDDICSICGDDPAIDYKLAGDQVAPDAISTLRLCGECLEIRRGMYGEGFVPFTN